MAVVDEAPPTDVARLGDYNYRHEVVPVERFFVDPEYQRQLTSLVSEIAENYNPFLLGAVIGSDRATSPAPHGRTKEPHIALIDGQTRWEGTKRNLEQPEPVAKGSLLAVVYERLRPEDEALIFALIQMKRRNMTSFQRWRAMLRAKQPTALALARIAQDEGWTMDPANESESIKAISAMEAVLRVDFDSDDPQEQGSLLRETLGVLKAAWPQEGVVAASADLIRGTAWFIETREPELDRLVTALQRVNPQIVQFNAGAYRAGKSGGSSGRRVSVADAIEAEYTKRKR